MRSLWFSCVMLVMVAAAVTNCLPQEIASIDLTNVSARTQLRRPASTPGTRQTGGVLADHRCTSNDTVASPADKTASLRTELVSLDRPQYRIGDDLTIEVIVKNVGSRPLEIPFSPNLADLQPENPAQKFGYSEIDLSSWAAAGDKWIMGLVGVRLYGAEDHAGTMITLGPGGWVRIKAKDKIRDPLDYGITVKRSDSSAIDHAYAQVSLFHLETLVAATSSATISYEICLRQTHDGGAPISITAAAQ